MKELVARYAEERKLMHGGPIVTAQGWKCETNLLKPAGEVRYAVLTRKEQEGKALLTYA